MNIEQKFKVEAYLCPSPFDPDSEFEDEFISWLPGYKKESAESGSVSYWSDENIALYEKIQEFAENEFNKAFARLRPLFEGIYIKTIDLQIDVAGFGCSKTALAGYNYNASKPAKGKYVFSIDQALIGRYAHFLEHNNTNVLPTTNIWEHELIHMLDNNQIIKGSLLMSSEIPENNLSYYKLKYREEGLANLFDLMDGKVKGISSIQEAKDKFNANEKNVLEKLESVKKSTTNIRSDTYAGYDFYEIGPWLMLAMLNEFPIASETIDMKALTEKIEKNETIKDDLKLEVMKYALRLSVDYFFDNIDKIKKGKCIIKI